MTVSQHFGRFAIPFRLPLVFSPWMAQSSSEGPIGHKFFFSANRLSKYGILKLVKSRYLVIFPRMSLSDLLQESPPQVSLHLSVDVFGLPELGSLFMVTRPSQK
jgi:hypothetical protein